MTPRIIPCVCHLPGPDVPRPPASHPSHRHTIRPTDLYGNTTTEHTGFLTAWAKKKFNSGLRVGTTSQHVSAHHGYRKSRRIAGRTSCEPFPTTSTPRSIQSISSKLHSYGAVSPILTEHTSNAAFRTCGLSQPGRHHAPTRESNQTPCAKESCR